MKMKRTQPLSIQIKSTRIALFVLIIIGICLLITQNMWVPPLVSQILASQNQSVPTPSTAKLIVPVLTPPVLTVLIPVPAFDDSGVKVQYSKLLDSYHPANPKPTDACAYDISFVYPRISGVGAPLIEQKINAHLKQSNETAFKNTQKDFKALLTDTTLAQRAVDCNGASDSEFTYKAALHLQKFPNVLSFEIHSYVFTGGTHGEGETSYENYDLTTGNDITLNDVFISSSNYLDQLSSYLTAAVPLMVAQSKFVPYRDAGLVSQGLAPKISNFDNFYLTDRGVAIQLHTNQISSYVHGQPPAIVVPYSYLNGVLNPKGPVASIY